MMKSLILRERFKKLPIKESHKILKLKGTVEINELSVGMVRLRWFFSRSKLVRVKARSGAQVCNFPAQAKMGAYFCVYRR